MKFTETELIFISEGIDLQIEQVKRSNELRAGKKLDLTQLYELKDKIESYLNVIAARTFDEKTDLVLSQKQNFDICN